MPSSRAAAFLSLPVASNAFRMVARSVRSSLSEYSPGCLPLSGMSISPVVIQSSFANKVARLTTILSSRMFPGHE